MGEVVVEATRQLQQGNTGNAQKLLEQVVSQAPHVAVFRYLLGLAQYRQNLREAAISNFGMAVREEKQNVDFLVAFCGALMTGRPAEAIDHLNGAVHLGLQHPKAYGDLADKLIDANKADEALRVCDAGLAVCGEAGPILRSRGKALSILGRCDDGLEALRKAEALLPHDQQTMVALGTVLRAMNRVQESRSYLERACNLEPANADVHLELALVLLLQGEYIQGFREYEQRWGTLQAGARKNFARPLWTSAELQGRRVLLEGEQGAGDTIQFARYTEFVKAKGGIPILHTLAPLRRLLSWLPDCEVTAANDSALPAFDLWCPLMSLPHLAATDVESIPPPARFAVPSEMKGKWSAKTGEKTGMRVGIVWAGNPDHFNDRNRSLPLDSFRPLLDIPKVNWFSLQVGPAAAQLAETGFADRIVNLASELTDYAETAAAISQLDLVITADTSVAHLAGSSDTAVWTLLPFAPDWRWLVDRDDSPWYPGMRLFRQKSRGDWEGVIGSVTAALREVIASAE